MPLRKTHQIGKDQALAAERQAVAVHGPQHAEISENTTMTLPHLDSIKVLFSRNQLP
jgi:hypothetical protein